MMNRSSILRTPPSLNTISDCLRNLLIEEIPVPNRARNLILTFFGFGLALASAHRVVAKRWVGDRALAIAAAASTPAALAKGPTLEKYADLPISFERNGDSGFVARGRGYAMRIHDARATIALSEAGTSSSIGMEFVSARHVVASPEKELPGKVNYIIGNDRRRWRLGLPTYERVIYRGLYPGIDVAYYGNQKQLEFDLVLEPEASVRSIRMRFTGAGKPTTDSAGRLVLGDLKLLAPKVIQGDKPVEARYTVLPSGEVAFELGAYDRHKPLTIDPTLIYSTRIGGGNSSNTSLAITLDASGSAYIAGSTFAADFPVVNAAFAGYQANGDAFVSKVNAAGTAIVYSTYIGGSNSEQFRGIAVDSSGAAWAVGFTNSTDFPLLSPSQNQFAGIQDAVVVKLSPTGALAYSTFLGGPGQDVGFAVAVDPFGNAYAAGYGSAGFPTTPGVYQANNQGSLDAFVTKFSSSGSLTWSTLVGGTSLDYATGIAVDLFGNSYITGQANSASFFNAPLGGAQPVNRGSGDAFVAKLNFNASALSYFTFLGGSGTDVANAISADPITGIAVVAGQTRSTDLLTSPGALQAANAGGSDGFVAKVNAAGTGFLYTTYLGGTRNEFLNGVAIDHTGNAYVIGYTNSNNVPTSAPIQTGLQGNSTTLFRTVNTGASWTVFDSNLPGPAAAISPDPTNANTLIASTEVGLYRTTNAGTTWTQQFANANLNLARSPADAATIYGAISTAVYRSVNSGVSWTFMGSVPQCCATDIVADPLSVGTAYVYGFAPFGVQKTTNGGVTWTPANTGLPPDQNVRTMVAASDGSLYVGLDAAVGALSALGVYKSTNQGATWVPVNTGLHTNFTVPPRGLAVAPTNPSVLYVTDYFTLYQSTNGGTTWTRVGPAPGGTGALIVSTTSISTLYYGAYDAIVSLFVSTNSGVTWTPTTGLGIAPVFGLVADPATGGAYVLSRTNHAAIVAKIDAAGQSLLYSSYLGDGSFGFGIATNGTGDAFVTGYVADANPQFPITPGALQANRSSTDAFLARISDATAACSYSVDPRQSLEVWFTHEVEYSVTAPSGCAWTASSNQPWATIVSGASGTGSGVVHVLAANTSATTLTATLTIAGQTITMRQRTVAGCGYNVFSPEAVVVPGAGGIVQFNVVVAAGCEWTITNNDPTAIQITAGASGTGNGLVTLTVAPNLGPNTRTFIVQSPQGDQETISQAGTTAPAVITNVTSSPPGALITVSGAGCIPGSYTTPASLTWNANTNCTTVFETPQFIGASEFTFNSASVNGGPGTTENPLTVNSGTSGVAINATFFAPCSYSLAPSGQTFAAAGGLGAFTVTTTPNCTWKPIANVPWITVLASGSQGTGKANFAVAANSAGARVGAIVAGNQSFNITQSGFSCSYSIGPANNAFTNAGGDFRVTVTAPAGCAWSAVGNVPWLRVTAGASGSGSGAVTLHADPNTGGARSGTATIAGGTFSATQAAAGSGINACGATDVSSSVSVARSGVTWAIGTTYEYTGTITVKANALVRGPVYLVLNGLPNHQGFPHEVGLVANGPLTKCFSPQGDYLLSVSGSDMTPGQSIKLSLVFFSQMLLAGISYSTTVLSGTPTR